MTLKLPQVRLKWDVEVSLEMAGKKKKARRRSRHSRSTLKITGESRWSKLAGSLRRYIMTDNNVGAVGGNAGICREGKWERNQLDFPLLCLRPYLDRLEKICSPISQR